MYMELATRPTYTCVPADSCMEPIKKNVCLICLHLVYFCSKETMLAYQSKNFSHLIANLIFKISLMLPAAMNLCQLLNFQKT